MRLAEKGANKDQIKFINDKITELVNHVKIKQEDMSDKFGLLKRVETILHNLYESR